MSFAKLDSGIVNSTIWVQPHDVLRVWVWFLSQADSRGVVRTAAPALSLVCMVPIERMRDILRLLESPDEDSRTPDFDGRRIEKIEGGWRILNYGKYRESRDPDARREQNREAQQRHRDKIVSQSKPEISQGKPDSAKAEAEAERSKANTLRVLGERSASAEPAAAMDAAVDEAKDAASSAIPVARIVDLYHEHLPELPRVEKLTRARRGYLQQRWREDLHSLDEWKNFFDFVRASPFLMGRKPGREGNPPFRASLDWLTRPENFAKISEEKYHRG